MHPNFFYPSIRAMFDIIHRIVVPQQHYQINLLNAHLLHHVWHLDKRINISYIIKKHMNAVVLDMLALPYGSLITRICIHFMIELPIENMFLRPLKSENILTGNRLRREYGLHPHRDGWYIWNPCPFYILPRLDGDGNEIPNTAALNFVSPRHGEVSRQNR